MFSCYFSSSCHSMFHKWKCGLSLTISNHCNWKSIRNLKRSFLATTQADRTTLQTCIPVTSDGKWFNWVIWNRRCNDDKTISFGGINCLNSSNLFLKLSQSRSVFPLRKCGGPVAGVALCDRPAFNSCWCGMLNIIKNHECRFHFSYSWNER